MKILKDGQEVKDAIVRYGVNGRPEKVQINGVHTWYPAGDFEFIEDKTSTKTKATKAKKAKRSSKK